MWTILVATVTSVAALLAVVLLGELFGAALLIPPMAASMALIAGAPQLPLSQPRNVIGGHLASAATGVGVGVVSHSLWAAAVAGGLSLGVMLLLRIPHSPAAATAILAALTTTDRGSFVVCAVVAACVLVCFGLLRSRLEGTCYPTTWR